jgi:predicted flavoprotein YhiN
MTLQQAVVIGGSVAGLLAARLCSEYFQSVTQALHHKLNS